MSELPNAGQGPSREEDAAKKKAQEEQLQRELMATLLDTNARERLSRIALVSPDRSRLIEGILSRMAQSGQLRGRVSEAQLIQLLEQMEDSQGTRAKKESKIVYQRRRDYDDDFDF